MSLSEREIGLLLEELVPLVDNSTLQRVFEADPRTLVLRFRATGQNHFLLLSTQTDATRLYFVDDKPDQPDSPSSFTMLVRKWLEGASLTGVEQINDDRVVRLDVRTIDPRWTPPEDEPNPSPPRRNVALICELAGRVGNVFLVDEQDRVIGQQTDEAIAGRSFGRGDRWTPPPEPPQNAKARRLRFGLDDLDTDGHRRSEAVREAYAESLEARRAREAFQDLRSRLKGRQDQLERRLSHIREDLEEVRRADKYKQRAELLQQAYGQVQRGDEAVTVPNFYADDMEPVEIPLDPSRSLQENIDAYFHQAKRYRQAQTKVEERLDTTQTLKTRVEDARARLHALESDDAEDLPSAQVIQELKNEWIDEGLLEEASDAQQDSATTKERRARPYREFMAHSGRSILVGKGAEENDTLSTKIARGRDMWFHARDFPGAHVVLRLENRGEAPSQEDLLDAATLAAHFSGGRRDTGVEVTYTRAKYVRKTKNLPAGRVYVSDESVIGLRLDDERLQRLLQSEQ
jgi:predicted ribosome quality control (RQC) complex YloA/Tae2 family protein